jgi:hypothetical protein
MTWFITAFVALGILLLLISPYSRKATVEGYLKTTTEQQKYLHCKEDYSKCPCE